MVDFTSSSSESIPRSRERKDECALSVEAEQHSASQKLPRTRKNRKSKGVQQRRLHAAILGPAPPEQSSLFCFPHTPIRILPPPHSSSSKP